MQIDANDILSDEDIVALGALKLRLEKLRDSVKLTNQMAAQLGLDLSLLDTYDIGHMANEISVCLNRHVLAVQQRRDKAIERMAA